MATTREILEETVTAMEAFADQCDAKQRMSNADRERLDGYSEKVTGLVAKMKRDNGEQVAANPSLAESMAFFKSLSEPMDDPFLASLMNGGSGSPPVPGGGGYAFNGAGNVAKDRVADFSFSEQSLKSLQTGAINRQVTAKAAITSTLAPMANAPDYRFGVFPWLRDAHRVLDLIPKDVTEGPSVHYFRALAAASAAATVAQGANKPESSPTWEEVTANVRKIAHYTRVNDEVIADFRAFLDVCGTEMIAGLIDVENAQLIAGDGTGQNLLGLMADPNVLTVGSLGTDLDAIAAAMLALRTGAAHCDADAILMHPADWFSTGFLLAKDTTGTYLLGNPVSGVKPSLWGVPVIVSEHVTQNTAVVANLKIAATVYVRQPPTLEVAPFAGSAEFIANQTLIRAEERLTLAIHHPKAICLVSAI